MSLENPDLVDPSEDPDNALVDPSEDEGGSQSAASEEDAPQLGLAGDGPNRDGE